jgi:hypothetical protein
VVVSVIRCRKACGTGPVWENNSVGSLKKRLESKIAPVYNHAGANLDGWLTVHRSITLVDPQLDALNSCLFT